MLAPWSPRWFFLVVPVTFGGNAEETDVVGGPITTSKTWDLAGSPYVLQGDVSVEACATLVIEAGVEVRFAGDFHLKIGGQSTLDAGKLVALGTSMNPIVFRSDDFVAHGAWSHLWFDTYTDPTSAIAHCTFENGGSTLGAVYVNGSAPALADMSFVSPDTNGLHLVDANPALSGVLSLTGSTGHLLFATSVTSTPTFSGVDLASSGALAQGGPDFWANLFNSSPTLSTPGIAEVLGGTLTSSSAWGGVPNLTAIKLLGTLVVEAPVLPVLTLLPGTTVKLGSNQFIRIGDGIDPGALVAVGTDQDRVVFERSGASAWNAILFGDKSDDSLCRMEYCTLDGGGGGVPFAEQGQINVKNASPLLSKLRVENSMSHGIMLLDSAARMSDIEVLNFGAGSAGFQFDSNASDQLTGVNTVTGPGQDGVVVNSTSSPFLAGLTIASVSQHAIVAAVASNPTFGATTVHADVPKLGIGGPDFWAAWMNSMPTLLGSGWVLDLVGGTLTQSTTWGGNPAISEIRIDQGSLTIEGSSCPVLTLAPGTTVRLGGSNGIFIGLTTPGALMAVGDTGNEIVFERSGASNWFGLSFEANADGTKSSLAHCILRNGGTAQRATVECKQTSPSVSNILIESAPARAIRLDGSETLLQNISIQGFGASSEAIAFSASELAGIIGTNSIVGPGGSGIVLEASVARIEGVSFASITGYPILADFGAFDSSFSGITVEASVTSLMFGGPNLWASFLGSSPTLLGSGYFQEVDFGTLSVSSTWGALPQIAEIHLLGSLTIDGAGPATLTLVPGTQVRLASGKDISVGGATGGALNAQGVPSQRIVFDTISSPDKWGQIVFQDKSDDATCALSRCDLINGGGRWIPETGSRGRVFPTSLVESVHKQRD